jgi:Icc-related predicted phosphoesterase
MNFLYVTDLHGVQWKYERIFEVIKSSKIKTVINGGDMLPMGKLMKQDKFILDFLDDHFSKFNSKKIFYLGYLGNDDLRIFDNLFQEICDKYSYIINIAQKNFEVDNYEYIGMNWVVDFPFALKDRARKDMKDFIFPKQFGNPILSTTNVWKRLNDWVSYAASIPTIEEEMNQLIKPKNMEQTIYIIHTPPSNLGLDVCHDGRKVGSKAIFNFIKKNQPLLTLHGHIHESPDVSSKWYSKLGKTICIQPGQSHHYQDYLIYVIIDLKTMQFERFQVLQ